MYGKAAVKQITCPLNSKSISPATCRCSACNWNIDKWLALIPALTGRAPPNDIERNLFALPPWWGGLELCNPVCLASHEYDASLKITEPLCKLLLSHDRQYPEVKADQLLQKSTVRSFKQQCYSRNSSDLHQQLSSSLQLAVNLATEKGASSWLTTLPLEEYGFALHKSAFQDALALRYGWLPLRTPAHCACGSSFSVDHALSCPKGGLPSIRHNEIRDLTAKLLTEVCSQVATDQNPNCSQFLQRNFLCQQPTHRTVLDLTLS